MANEPPLEALSPESQRRIQDGKALPAFFRLSSEDEKQPVPRLSVWVEGLTTVAQAWDLVGAKPNRRWVLFLGVDQVRTVRAKDVPGYSATPPLDVQWEPAKVRTEVGEWIPDSRPGSEGHAGVANLDKGNKTQREELRWRLADLASVRILSQEEITAFTAQPPSAADQSNPPTPS